VQIVELFWPAFLLLVVLVGIHAIFGLEIIKRGVIFTDLAIGQMAAVGMAISIGFMAGAYQSLLTFGFALLGAFIIVYVAKRVEHIEAFIGMLYAFSASGIMILLSSSPDGAELFQKLSATDILFTSANDVYIAMLLYGAIAFVMFMVYPKLTGALREYTFFTMLALMVTSSVQLAGVLVVFVLLVAPAFIALSQKRFKALYFAWIVGLLVSMLALVISYHYDFPTGYSIVFFQGLAVLLYAIFKTKSL